MKKYRILALLLLVSLLLTACGKSYTCDECGETTKKAYYTMAHSEEYVLCESCAEDYWWPLDYTQFAVDGKGGEESVLETPGDSNSVAAELPAPGAPTTGMVFESGYYGYVDENGNCVTGFVYDDAGEFVSGYCVVRKGKGYGLVDDSGREALAPTYAELRVQNGMIWFRSEPNSAYSGLGLMDLDLNVILSDESGIYYEDFVITDRYIFAQEQLANSDVWHIYDRQGSSLLATLPGNGHQMVPGYDSTASAVSVKYMVNGVIRVLYESDSYLFNGDWQHVCYLDENLNLINDKLWSDKSSDFNARGYAAAQERTFSYKSNGIYYEDAEGWSLIGMDGSVMPLPKLPAKKCLYADPWFTISSLGSSKPYYLASIQTGEVTELSEYEEIAGCLVVKHRTSGLYGIVDGEDWALPCRHSEIRFEDGVFYLEEGTETTTYTPKGFVPLKSSGGAKSAALTLPAPAETLPAPAPAETLPAPAPAETVPAVEAAPSVPPVNMQYVRFVMATSALAEASVTHSADRLWDNKLDTAWTEGVSGQGIGEAVVFTFDGTYLVSKMNIASGYQKSEELFTKNSRPKTLTLMFSDGQTQTVAVEDTIGVQSIYLDTPVETSSVTVMISDVYPGTRWEDTCISELHFT